MCVFHRPITSPCHRSTYDSRTLYLRNRQRQSPNCVTRCYCRARALLLLTPTLSPSVANRSPVQRQGNTTPPGSAHLNLDGDAGVVAQRLLAPHVKPDAGVVLERVAACTGGARMKGEQTNASTPDTLTCAIQKKQRRTDRTRKSRKHQPAHKNTQKQTLRYCGGAT